VAAGLALRGTIREPSVPRCFVIDDPARRAAVAIPPGDRGQSADGRTGAIPTPPGAWRKAATAEVFSEADRRDCLARRRHDEAVAGFVVRRSTLAFSIRGRAVFLAICEGTSDGAVEYARIEWKIGWIFFLVDFSKIHFSAFIEARLLNKGPGSG
jgi:hypothetical protein